MITTTIKPAVKLVALLVCLNIAFITAGCQEPTGTQAAEPKATKTAPTKTVTTSPAKTDDVTVSRYIEDTPSRVAVELSNGMIVIAQAVHKAPVVCVKGFVHAGGIYEGKYLGCGISHQLEHLVAKDNDKIAGLANAYTSTDHTCYYISAPSSQADECIDFIADTLARPTFTEADFIREHGVVQRELEMGKDNPQRIFYYTLNKNIYGNHPAAVPVIGYAKPLAGLTFADVKDYHHRMYTPQNMVFAIAGDINPAKAVARAVKSLQGFQETRQADYNLPAVAPVAASRKIIQPSEKFQETKVAISFLTIPLVHKDLYTLDLLSYILTNGQSSRLVKKLVFDKKLVTSINSWSYTPSWGKGTFTVTFRCKPELADKATQAVIAELKKIKADGLTVDEINQAKTQKTADYVNSQQTVESIAGTLASDMMMTGDMNFSKNYTERIQKTKGTELLKTARKYFRFNKMIVTRIEPQKFFNNSQQAKDKNDKAKTAAGKPELITLDNGLRVVLCRVPEIPKVAMTLACRGGLLAETPETNGMGAFMTAMSTRGAGDMTGQQITRFFNSAGGSISAICGDNTWVYSADVLSKKFDKSLKIFADVVQNPTFPGKQLESVRPLLLANIKRTDEHWMARLNKFHRSVFYQGSPWQMPKEGSAKVIEKATSAKLKKFHNKNLLAGQCVLAIYGDFDVDKTKAKIEKLFGKMKKGENKIAPNRANYIDKNKVNYKNFYSQIEKHLSSIPPHRPGLMVVEKAPLQQAGVMISAPAPLISNTKDRLPLMILDTIISGYRMPCGWMHEQLRGQRLVYVVHTLQKSGLLPGGFTTYAGTQPDKAQRVIDIIINNLRKASTYKPTQEEIDKAVRQIIAAEVLGDQTLESLSFSAALNELYGLGLDWPEQMVKKLSAVTAEDITAAAQKYLTGGYVITVVTPKPELLNKESNAGKIK